MVALDRIPEQAGVRCRRPPGHMLLKELLQVRENRFPLPQVQDIERALPSEEALVPQQGANFVWVVAENKATMRQVGIGVRTPGFVEVTSGLDSGEQVVVGGAERLFPGAPVMARVVERGPVVTPAER